MTRFLSDCDTAELMTVLSSNYVLDVCGGTGTMITESLPGKAVCAIQVVNGHMYFFIDLEKPLAYRHARQMLREWRAAQVEAAVVGDVPSDPVPNIPEPQGPCTLSLVG